MPSEEHIENLVITRHEVDLDGNPGPGFAFGYGFSIAWRYGRLSTATANRPANGASVVGVIQAVIDRIQFYQDNQFKCDANRNAMNALRNALDFLAPTKLAMG